MGNSRKKRERKVGRVSKKVGRDQGEEGKRECGGNNNRKKSFGDGECCEP